MNLGIFLPEQIRRVVVNFKNLPKNLVFVKSKLNKGRLHRKGSFNLNSFSSYVNILLFPENGHIRGGFSDGLAAPGAFQKEKSPQRKNIFVNELQLIFL